MSEFVYVPERVRAQAWDTNAADIKKIVADLPNLAKTCQEMLDGQETMVKDARVEMALANLVQKFYAAPGRTETRSSMIASALKAFKAAGGVGVRLPEKIEMAVDGVLGKRKT